MVTIAEYYERANAQWPEGMSRKVPTAEEAEKAIRKLWRWAFGRTMTLPTRITSGNRATWIGHYRGHRTFRINPDNVGVRHGGWSALVHDFSHYVFMVKNRGKKPHCREHARLEARAIREVLKRGWLDGKLCKKPKLVVPTPEPTKLDKARAELVRVDELIEREEKRHARNLKRLRTRRAKAKRSVSYHERKTEAS